MGLSLRTLFSSLKAETAQTQSRVVGIDIGSSSVKVVELEVSDKAPILRTYGELQLGPYDTKDLGAIVQLPLKKRTEALVDVWRESGVVATQAVLALQLPSSFVTVISVDLKKGEELATRIPVEARKYIPVPLTEITLDWVELPAQPGDKKDNTEVLLVALLNEALIESSNLMQQVLPGKDETELEIFSVLRAVAQKDITQYACIDIGAQFSRLYVVRDGLLERIHRSVFGGSVITEKLAQMRSISFTEAEQLKRSKNQPDDVTIDVRQATASTLEAVLQEFKRVIDQYEAKHATTLQTVYITGGVAQTTNIAQYVQELLQRSVEVATPFSNVAYPVFMQDTLKEIGSSFTVSLGAALRQVE